jgi:hypothetical protein
MWQRRWLTPAASGAAQPGIDEDLIPVLIQVNYVIVNLFKYIYNVSTIVIKIYIILQTCHYFIFSFFVHNS